LADLLERDAKILATLETLENGKPLKQAYLFTFATASTLRYYAGLCDKVHGQTIPAGELVEAVTVLNSDTSLIINYQIDVSAQINPCIHTNCLRSSLFAWG
jgi:acyl-CoA reductase-like NAD-dependent aldehyde dehydrogenase